MRSLLYSIVLLTLVISACGPLSGPEDAMYKVNRDKTGGGRGSKGGNDGGGGKVKGPTTTLGRFTIKTAANGVHNVYLNEGRIEQWVATFTTGCQTVTMSGDSRNLFDEGLTITHSTWVRLLNVPFNGQVDTNWILTTLPQNSINAGSPDIIDIAMLYLEDGDSNAAYGPQGSVSENSDFNDYLGTDTTYSPHWSYDDQHLYNSWTHYADANRLGCLDCSGYMRMIWGYHGGLPMTYHVNPNAPITAIPRRSYLIWEECIGKQVMTNYDYNSNKAADKLALLNIGDLVVFDADDTPAEEIGRVDHIGMYIGDDAQGNMRFVHSRSTNNIGPTFGNDAGGKCIINNDGTDNWLYYAKALVGARRL